MSEFIFPTENHMVICSAHKRKAAGHLKVDHDSMLTMHFPFLNIRVKGIDFFVHLVLLHPTLQTCVCPLSLSLWFLEFVNIVGLTLK